MWAAWSNPGSIPEAEVLGRKARPTVHSAAQSHRGESDDRHTDWLPWHWRIHDIVSLDHFESADFDIHGRAIPHIRDLRTVTQGIFGIVAEHTKRGRTMQLLRYVNQPGEYDRGCQVGGLETSGTLEGRRAGKRGSGRTFLLD